MELSAELLALNSEDFASALLEHRNQELAAYKVEVGTTASMQRDDELHVDAQEVRSASYHLAFSTIPMELIRIQAMHRMY